MIAIVPLQRIF